MFGTTRIVAAAVLAAAGIANAGDTVRLVDRPGDQSGIQRLDIQPADRDVTDAERTCWYGGAVYRYPVAYAVPYPVPVAPITYYRAPVAYYPAPMVRYYYGSCCCCCGPRVVYYRPMIRVRPLPPPVMISADGVRGESPQEPRTFRYDGGPAAPLESDRIPPAREAVPSVPKLPEAPGVPKLGPSPSERMISSPAAPAPKKYAYPAYGEDRQPKPAPRDDKSLLIRRS